MKGGGQQRNSIPEGGNSNAQALRRHVALQELKKGQCGQEHGEHRLRDEHGPSLLDLAGHVWHLVWILSLHLCGQGLEDLHGSWCCLRI